MSPAELDLAAFDTGVISFELLIFIIKTTQEVRKLKAKCDEVRSTASILKKVLEANTDVVKGQETAIKLEMVLVEVSKFVVECKESNILHRAWETIWDHRLPGLLKEMMMWIALLSAETTVSTRSDLWKLISKADESYVERDASLASILSKLEILDELKKSQDEAKQPNLEVDFPENDSRLTVEKDVDDTLRGTLILADATIAKVICEPVKEDLMRYGEKGPRHILIYAKLSANTLVHPFYGIAQRFKKRYTVMKDLREYPTLGTAISDGNLPNSVLERLDIAYSIAKTVEYLHSVEVLVKRLSDTTVLLFSRGGIITPYLTDLDKARLFKETTSGGKYDVRYEAPEFQKFPIPKHGNQMDIWSLGILIWQCASGSFPFESSEEVVEGAKAEEIRKIVTENSLPWKTNPPTNPLLRQVARLAERCCNFRPNSRPSSADVSHSLFDIMTLATLGINESPQIDDSVKDRVSELLEKAKTKGESLGRLSSKDVRDIRELSAQGDPTAAYLFGSAIWFALADPGDDLPQLLLLTEEDGRKELRARSSLPHLEFAMQAGVKSAAEILMQVHGTLMKLYHAQVLQHRAMQSL